MQRDELNKPDLLSQLVQHGLTLSTQYHRIKPSVSNEERERQIAEITVLHESLQQFMNLSPRLDGHTNEYLMSISIGAWIYLLEDIDASYLLMSAAPKKKMLFRVGIKGSALYGLAASALSSIDQMTLDDKSRLVYLNELREFLGHTTFNNGSSLLMDRLIVGVNSAMVAVLKRLMNTIKKLIHAIPTQPVLNEKLRGIFTEYAKIRLGPQAFYKPRVDADRPFCAQLTQAIATLLKNEGADIADLDKIDRDFRIQLGLLIYMMRTIKAYDSKLYKLCEGIMNGKPDTLAPIVQIDCLSTLNDYLLSADTKSALINEARNQFPDGNFLINLDGQLALVAKHISEEIGVLYSQTHSYARVGVAAAAAGAVTVYPVGYGVGTVLGHVAAGMESPTNASLKIFITNWINDNAHYLLGIRGNGVGYIATTPIVNAVYQAVIGTTLGAGSALVVGGLSALSVMMICAIGGAIVNKMFHGSDMKDPHYVDQFDQHFLRAVECVPTLLDITKQQIEAVTGKQSLHSLRQSRQ